MKLAHDCTRTLLMILGLGFWSGMTARAGDMPRTAPATASVPGSNADADPGDLPQPLESTAFEALLTSPPFTRSLGVSDTLILTGIARFDSGLFATLLDTKTMDSQVVTATPNVQGWKLIGVGGDPAKSHTWTARIQIRGGETVSLRYQEPPPKASRNTLLARGPGGGPGGGGPGDGPAPITPAQADEARNAAVNYREGFTSDGYPRQPPPEMVEKLSRLSVQQREEINRHMIGIRNQGLGMEERRRIYEDLVNRAGQGRR